MSAAFELFDTCLMLVNKPLRQRSWPPPIIRVQRFPVFVIMMDSLTENIRKEAPSHTMFADGVVLCAREKDVLRLGTWAVEGSLGKARDESVKSKNRVHLSEWNAIRKC